MTIKSQAQHSMFTKAAADPEYAASRGIAQDMARMKLSDHAAAGNPALPERVQDDQAVKANAKRPKLKIFGMP